MKLPIYVRHAIAEVWLFNLQERVVSTYRNPGPKGHRRVLTPNNTETISPALLPDVRINLAEVRR